MENLSPFQPQQESDEIWQKSGQIIADSKNICLIPAKNPESLASALGLFFTLKDLGKNVNLIVEEVPEKLRFLSPSLEFISYPKNFVLSIPNRVANISQIYYEKNEEAVKIFLTLENGHIKKDDISFYFSETKPDLTITIGIKDYNEELKNRLNSFGYLLDSPILNIDSDVMDVQENKKFGKINLIRRNSLAEMVLKLLKVLPQGLIKKETASCLMSGIVLYTENFKKNITAEIFEASSNLMKQGADLQEIVKNING